MALPGVSTQLKDSFTALTRASAPSGPLICVIAGRDTASGTGGVIDLNPYKVTSEAQCIAAYGYGSQAHRAYLELAAGGATNMVVVALPQGTTDAQIADNVSSGNVTDLAFQAAGAALPDIVVPWGRGGHPLDWTAPGATPNAYQYDATPGNNASVPTTPGFGYSADMVCSDGHTPMAARVANAMVNITSGSNPALAVMGVRPYVGTGANSSETVVASELALYLSFNSTSGTGYTIPTGYTALANLANNAGVMGQVGPYLSVVVGESVPVTYPYDKTLDTFDWGYSNSACSYAALMSTLSPWVAPTGKIQAGTMKVRYNPTQSLLSNVDAMNMVPLGINFGGQPYFVDGTTFSQNGSDYARVATLRTVFSAVQAVRQLAMQFVGQPASLQIQNAFQTAVSSTLRGMITMGALNAADYNVTFSPVNNTAEVDLVLTPAFEIRSVSLVVSVNF